MPVVKKTVSLSSDLIDEAKVISSNFSQIVEEALREYIKHYYINKALESFGKWQHRAKDSIALTNEMREENGRWKHIQGSD